MSDRRLPPALHRRARVWDASEGRCHYCGKELHPFRDFEVEHVLAKCNGGTDDPANLVASCWRCNRRKRDTIDNPAIFRIDGPALRTLRQNRFLSQRELSIRSHVSEGVIMLLEIGKYARPSRMTTIRKLAKALGVEPRELLARETRGAMRWRAGE